jgi:predicted O-methyltransferase YrrM
VAALISVEGDPQLAAMARKNCQAAGLKNITILNRTFSEALPGILPLCSDQSMVYIDGNHTLGATLEFYRFLSGNETGTPLMVFDDIRWSPGMFEAWKKIRSSWPGITIELTRMGILLKSPSGPKQILKFNY